MVNFSPRGNHANHISRPRGFCAGVNMAIESLEKAVALYGTPIYVYHEIVHNRWVVEHFKDKGVVFVDDLAEVPEGSYLLFSAHGISPPIREQSEARKLKTIDATCPLVTKVHREAIRFAARLYDHFDRHAGHDEVIGTMGRPRRPFAWCRRSRTPRRSKSRISTNWPISRRRRSP